MRGGRGGGRDAQAARGRRKKEGLKERLAPTQNCCGAARPGPRAPYALFLGATPSLMSMRVNSSLSITPLPSESYSANISWIMSSSTS